MTTELTRELLESVRDRVLAQPYRSSFNYTQSITVDGVYYDTEAIRRLLTERHQLASQVTFYREKARLAEVHLQRRTAALVRLIARTTRFPQT